MNAPRHLAEALLVYVLAMAGIWLIPESVAQFVFLALCGLYVTVLAHFVHRDGRASWGLPRPRSVGASKAVVIGGCVMAILFLGSWPYVLIRAGVRRTSDAVFEWLARSPGGLVVGLVVGFGLYRLLAAFLIRWDRLRFPLWVPILWAATLLLAVGCAATTGDWTPFSGIQWFGDTRDAVLPRVFFYVLWAGLQQYCFLGYFNARLRHGLRSRLAVALVGGAMFGLIHLPSWPLVAGTFAVGTFFHWLWQEERNRDLFVFAVATGVAGTIFTLLTPFATQVGPWGR